MTRPRLDAEIRLSDRRRWPESVDRVRHAGPLPDSAGRAPDERPKVASVQGVQRTLSAMLSQGVEDATLSSNPAFRMGCHARKGDEPRREIPPLMREDAHTFLTTVREHWPKH